MTGDQTRLVEAIALSPVAMAAADPARPDTPLTIVNPAFCALTGYAEAEAVGRNCRFLAGPGTEPWAREQLRAAIRERRPVLAAILNYRRDGTPFRNGVMITPLFDDNGEIAWLLGSQVDLGTGEQDRLGQLRSAAARRIASLPMRQRQVLAAMAQGRANKQIAWELKIQEKTVKMHRALLLERLGVTTSAEAIRLAVEGGL